MDLEKRLKDTAHRPKLLKEKWQNEVDIGYIRTV